MEHDTPGIKEYIVTNPTPKPNMDEYIDEREAHYGIKVSNCGLLWMILFILSFILTIEEIVYDEIVLKDYDKVDCNHCIFGTSDDIIAQTADNLNDELNDCDTSESYNADSNHEASGDRICCVAPVYIQTISPHQLHNFRVLKQGVEWRDLEQFDELNDEYPADYGLLTDDTIKVLDAASISMIRTESNKKGGGHKARLNITYGKELNEKDKDYITKSLEGIHTWKTKKWDVDRMNVPPMMINVKNEAKCKIFPSYRQNETDTKILKEEIHYWIQRGIARWSVQTDVIIHASPAFVVHRILGKTEDGQLIIQSRVVVNFTALNQNTYLFHHQNPTIEQIHHKISDYWRFNSTDIHKYFYHIMIKEECAKYMGISVPGGILIVNRVYQGLTNAPIYAHQLTTQLYAQTDVIPLQDDLVGGTELLYKGNKKPHSQWKQDEQWFESELYHTHCGDTESIAVINGDIESMHDKKDEYVFDGQQTLKRLNAINLNQYHPSTCITETLNDFKPYTQNASIYVSEIFEINIAHHARNHHNSSVKSKTIAHIQKQGVEPDYERTKQQG
eukprot:535750_1